MACSVWSPPSSSSRGHVNVQTPYRKSAGSISLPIWFIIVASALALAAGCGAPATPISIRNAVNSTAQPGEAPTSMVLAATAVPATRGAAAQATTAATQMPAATTDEMAGMNTSGTAAATQPAAPTNAPGGAATATPFVLANVLFGTESAATAAATQPAAPTNAPGGAATATPFLLTNALSGTQAATTQATTSTSQTTPTVSVATATTAAAAVAGTQAASASGGQGNPKHGQQIFTGVGTCTTCHDVAQGIQIVGPSLKGVATRAGTRKPGMSASDYLHESIMKPNAFVVPNFVAGIMPQNFAQTLSAKDIDDVVAYLLTLK